jgi:two-component system, chemotaxis family, CheB/CheR fusion protein
MWPIMNKKFAPTLQPEAVNPIVADEMDIGLLRRGDGMLPIVGLGGSAGGIAALQEFFAAMPVDSGMAFVVILHLSPHHESTLAEMFQRSTAMPVVAATDGVRVEPNFVYVIPPGKFLASVDGHLSLTDAQEPRGKRVAVDYFFRTLAESHGGQCLAVVLSGAGGDGALGLKRVKELGGLTIAQDPDQAEHPDMPRAAIATGVVDWVLGVNDMPAKLLAYVKQRADLKLPEDDGPHPAAALELSPDAHEAALRDVLAFLNTRTGRDFSCYKRATILRRIARRMQVNGLGDMPAYLVFLRTHAGEAGALLQDLLISVTNFFRDPAAFDALERSIPDLFKGKEAGDTVRVWVAGCATGEEAYSIAMLLSEHTSTLIGPPQIQVFATDLDEEIIREAREGLYPETIAADVSDERLQHFFIREQGGYRVRRAVRELVLFAPHDLLKDSPFSRLDLVSCRNLLIYLKREAQSRAFDIFHFALRPGGRLFLGTSEAVDEGSLLFAVLDKKQRLYVQRPGPQRLIAVPPGRGTLARALALQERTRERPTVPGRVTVESLQTGPVAPFDSGLPPGELHYRLIERFSPPSILVNSAHEIAHLSESAGRLLQVTGGEPTRNLLRMVHPMLRIELRAALYAAAQTQTAATAFRVPMEKGDTSSLVDIRVTPAGDLAPDFLLVVFEEHAADGPFATDVPRSAYADQAALHLERELVATKAHLRDTVEQSEASTEELKASNEELQAMNEELRSATEELETSREELQSINEELRTVNDELKSNVDQLARSNSDLQNLMAATDIATVFLDRELRITRFTPTAKTLFNLIPTDVGRPLSDLNRQLDYPEIVTDAEQALAHLRPAQREVSAGERWYIARILPYRTADDHIAGVVLTFLDITTRKESENAVRESSAQFRALAESIPHLAWMATPEGHIFWYNRRWYDYTGTTFEQMEGWGWQSVHDPAELPKVVTRWKASLASGQPFDMVFSIKDGDGEFRPFLTRVEPVKDDTGRVVHWFGTNTDISAAKRAEDQLRDGKEQLDFALAAADLGQWSLNLVDGTARRTLRHDQLFGYDALLPEWTYETFLQHVIPEDRAAVDTDFQKAVATGSPWAVECRIRRADGAERHIWTKALVRRDAEGEVEWMLGIVGDVTDRREAEERQAFLSELSDSLRPLSDPSDVQAEASRILGEQLGASRVAYFEVQGDNYVVERDYSDAVPSIVGRYPIASFGLDELAVLRAGRTAVETDVGALGSRAESEKDAFAALQILSYVAVPLIKGGAFVAGLAVHVASVRVWTPTEVAIIEETAERTWAAVQRVRAEAELLQSGERLRMALRAARMVAWEYDPSSGAVFTSDNASDVYGFSPGEEMGSIDRGLDILHPDDVERHRAVVVAAVAAGEGFTSQFRIVRPDTGAVQWMEEQGHAVSDGVGTTIRLIGVNMDITQRKAVEDRLREREAFIQRILDASPGVVYVFDRTDGRTAYINDQVRLVLGIPPEDVVTSSKPFIVERGHPDDLPALHDHIGRLGALSDGDVLTTEYRMRHADGRWLWFLSRDTVFQRTADGAPKQVLGVASDITARKEAEDALRDADRRKDEFLATLAHELRNPLAPIRSGLHIIRMAGAAGKVEQARAMMDRQVTQLVRLVDDLLDVSRITSGKLELRQNRVDLRAVIDAALETSRPAIEHAGLEFTACVPDEPIWVKGDHTRLAQVVSNLLNNSAKYTHLGGSIRLKVQRQGAQALVSIADDGIGIPRNMLDKVFAMFTQVDRTLEKTTGGLGIGLSLVKALVEMHGGSIEARSEGDRKGSEFVVCLPVITPEFGMPEAPDGSAEAIMTPVLQRILVVDDNVDAADSLAQLLELQGHEVRTAYDGHAGIEAARIFRPSVVVCDIGMPKLNGYNVARSIRSEEWGKNMVLVALTGWGQDDDREKSAYAGFDHHLVKPVDDTALLKVLGGL